MVVWVWALVRLLRRPPAEFVHGRLSKGTWLLALLFGWVELWGVWVPAGALVIARMLRQHSWEGIPWADELGTRGRGRHTHPKN
jgi:hypothetical protein